MIDHIRTAPCFRSPRRSLRSPKDEDAANTRAQAIEHVLPPESMSMFEDTLKSESEGTSFRQWEACNYWTQNHTGPMQLS